MTEKFKPTEAILKNSSRGLAYINKFNRNIDKSQASLILKEELSLDDIKVIYHKLQKLEKSNNPKTKHQDGGPTDSTVEWLANGGTAGLAWTRDILKSTGILKSYTKEIQKEQINQEDEGWFASEKVIKGLDQELMQVTYVAMKPGVDLHGDLVELDEIRKAKESFNKSMMRANLFHLVMTDSFEVCESYLAPCDMVLNEHFVEKGTWLITLQVFDPSLWELIKNDEITGISIAATARVETIDE